jgi:CHASE2 domain-containing sensor protein
MDSDRFLTNLTYGIMKLGLMVFLFPFFWQFAKDPGILNAGANVSMSVFLIIIYVTLCFIIAVMSPINFNIFGFSVILLASLSMFFYILFKMGMHDGLAPYFLLICISIYFMTKVNRSRGR